MPGGADGDDLTGQGGQHPDGGQNSDAQQKVPPLQDVESLPKEGPAVLTPQEVLQVARETVATGIGSAVDGVGGVAGKVVTHLENRIDPSPRDDAEPAEGPTALASEEHVKQSWSPHTGHIDVNAGSGLSSSISDSSEGGGDGYEYTVDNSIDQIGWGRYQIKLLIVVAVAKGCMAMQLVLNAFNVHELKHSWKLTKVETTIMAGSIFWGMLVGSSFWGVVSDRYGRKKIFLLSILLTSVFGMAGSFCPGYASYTLLRFLLGFGLGGMGPVAIALLLEFTPSYCRGYASGLVWVGYYLGEVLEVCIGAVDNWGQNDSWRNLAVWTSLCPMALLFLWAIGTINIPESPRYLLIAGRQQEGWDVLTSAARDNRSVLFRQKLIGFTMSDHWVRKTESSVRGSVSDLFSPALYMTTVLLWIIWFVAGYGMYGMLFLLPRFLRRKTDIEYGEEHWWMLTTAIGALFGVLIGSIMSEVKGRKPAFIIGFAGAGAAVMLLNVSTSDHGLLLIAIVVRLFTGVYEAVWYTYTPEAASHTTLSKSLMKNTCYHPCRPYVDPPYKSTRVGLFRSILPPCGPLGSVAVQPWPSSRASSPLSSARSF